VGATDVTGTLQGGQAARVHERELIARWGAGEWRGWSLRAADGAHYTVVYQGRPGGPAGPDFRDAVLTDATGARLTGDIELHLSPAGWRAHGHGADPRYNGLALHVTLTAGRGDVLGATTLASGRRAPLVALAAQAAPATLNLATWPCADFAVHRAGIRASPRAQVALLRAAGWARFDERVVAFDVALQVAPATGVVGWSAADGVLFIALAEGLGYGRDRAALRACGERLARGEAPDALLTTVARLPVIERRRLTGLLSLAERWGAAGPLAALSSALLRGAERAGAAGAARALTEALIVAERGAVAAGRARILAFNVALPAVVAWARSQPSASPVAPLAPLALAVTEALPGLPSNQITREMARQLGLPRLPSGALAQQGLHHVWAQHCREKRCCGCPCAAPQDGSVVPFTPMCGAIR
jgi:hypothetical protein